ncbi:MAG: hypothetical protein NTW86_13895 [Candidatus Sumerlaeota bacterium]|nr:hypothetical protein [Candidatus Sumerlaeota bacterium]
MRALASLRVAQAFQAITLGAGLLAVIALRILRDWWKEMRDSER